MGEHLNHTPGAVRNGGRESGSRVGDHVSVKDAIGREENSHLIKSWAF